MTTSLTVAIYDTRDTACAQRTVAHCRKLLPFETKELIIDEPRIFKPWDYDRVILGQLHKMIDTSHVLIVQTDGYILNPNTWSPEYLKYDYIGAPWKLHPHHEWPPFPNVTEENRVGNGGFSLRSKRLMESAAHLFDKVNMDQFKDYWHPEDCFIARMIRTQLVGLGMKFAPYNIAKSFSVENELVESHFGFHGKLTMKINGLNYL